MTTGIIIAMSPAVQVKSHHNPSLFTFLIIILLPPPFSKKKSPHCILIRSPSRSGQIGNMDLISMSGTGGFGDDRTANKRCLIVTLPFSRLWFHACLQALSPLPIPKQEDGEKRKKSDADINAFSSRNATLCLHACLDICPAPGTADSAHRQAPSINQPLD